MVGFWQNTYAQEVLRKWVVQHLDGQQVDGHDLFKLDRLSEVADRVIELARANHLEADGPQMTSPLSAPLPPRIAVAGLDFEVQLSGARRTIGITVERDGSLIVTGPLECDEAALAAFAREKRMWVYKKLAEKDLLLSHRPAKEFVSGEGFTYLGRSHRLLLADKHHQPVKLERGRLVISRDLAERGLGARTIIDWYRTRALRWLPRRVEPWANRMGVAPSAIDVRDLGYRWGSLGRNAPRELPLGDDPAHPGSCRLRHRSRAGARSRAQPHA